jgi:hypothetical protein
VTARAAVRGIELRIDARAVARDLRAGAHRRWATTYGEA